MGLHKFSHTAGAREVGLMGAMVSCAPPNSLLIVAPTPRPCPALTPLSTAATQTELTMDDLAKLESKQAELKVENRRLKQRGYERKYKAKVKAKNQKLKRMLTNANQEQAARKVENKKPRTVSYPTSRGRLATRAMALAEVCQVWCQTYGAERSLWRVISRLRAERASDQSPSAWIEWTMACAWGCLLAWVVQEGGRGHITITNAMC